MTKRRQQQVRVSSSGWLGLALILSLFEICSCASDSISSRIVAYVGPQEISATDLALRLLQIPGIKESSLKTQLQSSNQALESLIDEELLYLEAKKSITQVSEDSVQHCMRAFKTGVGVSALSYFMQKNYLSWERLRDQCQKQIVTLQYLRRKQIEEKSFCYQAFQVHSSQNCSMKENLAKLRSRYPIVVNKDQISQVLEMIVGISR